MPKQQVGRGKVEEAERVRLHELRRSAAARAASRRPPGMRTAMMASHAFTEASRWLIGTDAADARRNGRHLVERPAFGELLEAAHLGDVEVRARDLAVVVQMDRDLGVAFDAGDRVDGDSLHGIGSSPYPNFTFGVDVRLAAFEQVLDHVRRSLWRGRAAGHMQIHLDYVVERDRAASAAAARRRWACPVVLAPST